MAFLARIIRMLLWLGFFAWAMSLLRRIFHTLAARRKAPREAYPASPLVPRPLHRDPWCGTHVSGEISYSLEQAGQTLHFCSAKCREHYRASQLHAASG